MMIDISFIQLVVIRVIMNSDVTFFCDFISDQCVYLLKAKTVFCPSFKCLNCACVQYLMYLQLWEMFRERWSQKTVQFLCRQLCWTYLAMVVLLLKHQVLCDRHFQVMFYHYPNIVVTHVIYLKVWQSNLVTSPWKCLGKKSINLLPRLEHVKMKQYLHAYRILLISLKNRSSIKSYSLYKLKNIIMAVFPTVLVLTRVIC